MEGYFSDFGKGQPDGEPVLQDVGGSRSVWRYGTARMEGVRGDEAMKVGRGIRLGLGGFLGGSTKPICGAPPSIDNAAFSLSVAKEPLEG